MAENELTDSATTPVDLGVKTELSEPDTSSPNESSSDFTPLHTTPMPKYLTNNNSVPIENNGNEKNGQKRIQTAPIDAVHGNSKKPRMNSPEDSNIEIETVGTDERDLAKDIGGDETNLKNEANKNTTDLDKKAAGDIMVLQKKDDRTGDVEEMDQSSDTEEYYLTVHNLPSEWTYLQIKNYLDQQIGHVDEMEMLKHRKSKSCAIRLTFQSMKKCTDIYKKLENEFVNDKKLKVKISDTYTTFPTGVTIQSSIQDSMITVTNETLPTKRWRPDLDTFDVDPDGLYGLRPEFLKALDIKPPLNRQVHVTNFRCDKVELKEVMEMAGNVLMCCVVATISKYAKVLYSHPLEAVQAISMLNGQLFYGVPLKITMDKNPTDSVVLPKGLANIGQGLGINARPIRNIAQQYHRYANKKVSSMNPIIFSEIDFTHENMNKIETEENSEEIQEKINEFLNSRPGCSVLNPIINQHLKTQNKDGMESPDSMETSDSMLELAKNKSGGKTNSVGSPQGQAKKGSNKQQTNSPRNSPAAPAAPAFGAVTPNINVRVGNPSGPGYMRPNIMMNPPMRNPAPMPGPRPFRPRVPFIPPPMQRPPFGQPRPPFGPPAGMRPQLPPAGMRPQAPPAGMWPQVPPVGMRPQVPQANFNGPRANMGNSVKVMFSNLPPSTTFPLLCDQLAQCGQVMSVQLTTPGCAVATFGHPSHAERCFQSFNGMNVEGYIIEVNFA